MWHVWVRPSGPREVPLHGYVIEFRRHSYRVSAFVLVAAKSGLLHRVMISRRTAAGGVRLGLGLRFLTASHASTATGV